jgi:hypothetical protein
VIFTLDLGKIESFGITVLSYEGNGALNMAIVDLRLVSFLVTIIALLKIAYSLIEFIES